MESIDFEPVECITKGKDIINLISKRGTLEILCTFCCSNKKIRFNELHNLMKHISTKTLASRLKEMNTKGFLSRVVFNEIPPKVEYSLTQKGQTLIEAAMPLIKWMVEEKGLKPHKYFNQKKIIKFTADDFIGHYI